LTPSGMERALVRAVYFVASLYVFIRMLLFILPPLNLWYAVAVSVVGMLTVFSATRFASKHRAFSEMFFVSSTGVALLMIGVTMAFQALTLYEGMNVALFATIVFVIGTALAGAVQDIAPQRNALGAVAASIATLPLPPSMMFVSVWMFVSVTIGSLSALPQPLALWFAIATLFMLGAMVQRGCAAVMHIRTVLAAEHNGAGEERNIPFLILVTVSLVGGFFVPYALLSIGAAPLTIGAETWLGGVVAADGMLRLGVLMAGVAVFSGAFWLARDKTALVPSLESPEMSPTVDDEKTQGARGAMLWRDVRKAVLQNIMVPLTEKFRACTAWHDSHAAKPISPALGFMLFVVILTLAIAL